MASIGVKCPNCNATLMMDSEKRVQFCPFCGAEYPKEETIYDYSRSVLKHNEEVRQQVVKEEGKRNKHFWIGYLLFALVFAAAIYFGVVAPHNSRVAKLEAIAQEIRQDIIDGNLDAALVKTSQLRLDDDFSGDENRKWDRQREELQALIKQKQKESK